MSFAIISCREEYTTNIKYHTLVCIKNEHAFIVSKKNYEINNIVIDSLETELMKNIYLYSSKNDTQYVILIKYCSNKTEFIKNVLKNIGKHEIKEEISKKKFSKKYNDLPLNIQERVTKSVPFFVTLKDENSSKECICKSYIDKFREKN
jgi:hypothetical protein